LAYKTGKTKKNERIKSFNFINWRGGKGKIIFPGKCGVTGRKNILYRFGWFFRGQKGNNP